MKRFFLLFTIILICFYLFCVEGYSEPATLIVIGSEPECLAAALQGSELGYDVTLITEDDTLGGLMTRGMLTALDLNYDESGKVLHQGFLTKLLKAASNGSNLDLKATEEFFNSEIKKHHIKVYKEATQLIPIVQNRLVVGVQFIQNHKYMRVMGPLIIDGSSDLSFSRKLGIPYQMGRMSFNQTDHYAAATLCFSVKGVDWKKVCTYLVNDAHPHSHYLQNAAWGYSQMYDYVPTHPLLKMRGLNLSRQNDGSIVINALLLFNVKPNDSLSYTIGYERGKAELPFIIEYMRVHCPGFEEATLDQIAKSLYIREGIRLVGIEMLQGDDVFTHQNFKHTIAYGSYPIDLQATRQDEYGIALCGKSLYSIPFGSMLPAAYDNLLIIGRQASFDTVAYGSARTLPILIQMAENGTAALIYSHQHHLSTHALNEGDTSWQDFIKFLTTQTDFKILTLPPSPLEDKWYTPYLRELMREGLLSIGYENRSLESPCTKSIISQFSSLISSHTNYIIPEPYKDLVHQLEDPISYEILFELLGTLIEHPSLSLEDLYEAEAIDELTYSKLSKEESPSLAATYLLFGAVLHEQLNLVPEPYYRDFPEFLSINHLPPLL